MPQSPQKFILISLFQLLSSGGSSGGHSSISPGSPGSTNNNITSPVPTAADRLTSSLSPAAGAQVSPAIGSPAVSSPATTASALPPTTDPVTGQLLADCDRLAALSYPRFGPMYSASYPSTDQNPYPSIAMENTFYGSLVSGKSFSHSFNQLGSLVLSRNAIRECFFSSFARGGRRVCFENS